MHESLMIIEILVLAAAAWPLLKVTSMPGLRRMFPRVFTALGVALIAWLGVIALAAVYLPAALHPLTALVVIVLAAAMWRARVDYGRARRLPPGSLSLTASIEAIVDRDFYRKQAALHGPIFKMSQFHRPVICIVDLERGHRLLREHEAALGPCTQPFTQEISGGFLRYMDDQTHDLYGPLFRQSLSAQVMAHAKPEVDELIKRELAHAAAEARQRGARSFAPESCLQNIVYAAFARALFGMSPHTPQFDALMGEFESMRRLKAFQRGSAVRIALARIRQMLQQQHEYLQSSAGRDNGAPMCALSELARLDQRMPDQTCLDNLVFILRIASSNVLGLMRWLLAILGDHPQWIDRLRCELDAGSPANAAPLIDRIITETLRLAQSEYLYRCLKEDVQFDGFVLPKDWFVRICVWECHRDPQNFRDPDQFDPDRLLGGDYSRSAYTPFGTRRHACNGVPLTNLICRCLLEHLTRDYHWSVQEQQPPQREFRHWAHWKPNPAMKLTLEPIISPAVAASVTSHG